MAKSNHGPVEDWPSEPGHLPNETSKDEPSARILVNSQGITRFMLTFILWLSLTAMIWSFDSSYAGVVLIMPTFNQDFGHCQSVHSAAPGGPPETLCAISSLQQSLVSLSNLFAALGSIMAGIFGAKLGRRGTMAVGGSLALLGAAGMLGTARNYTAYLACKCIGSVGIGQLYASSTVYGVEVVPQRKRGFLLALYNIGMSLGIVVAAAVCYASSYLKTNWQWRLPIVLQIPLSLSIVCGVWLFPESPRWLMINGRNDEARTSFARFFNKGPQSREITAQIQETGTYIELEETWQGNSSWISIFGRRDMRRTLSSALILSGLALTGQPFISTYGSIFLQKSGIHNPYVIIFILSLCSLAGTPIGPFVTEYGGRRLSMLIGYAGMAVCMLILASVHTGLKAQSQIETKVLISFICLWVFNFAAFVTPASWTSSTELHSLRLRTYGQAFSAWCNLVLSFVMSFSTPYMLAENYGNMGTNVGYFYFSLTVIVFMLIFLFIPETARLSLEQIDDFFTSDQKAWTTSVKKNKKLQE